MKIILIEFASYIYNDQWGLFRVCWKTLDT